MSGFEVGLLGQLDASRRDALLRILASHAQTSCNVSLDELFFGRGAGSDAAALLRLRCTRRSDASEAPWELHIAQAPKPAARDGSFDVLIRPIVACPLDATGSTGSPRSQAIELAQALGYSFRSSLRRHGVLFDIGPVRVYVVQMFSPHNAPEPLDAHYLVEAVQTLAFPTKATGPSQLPADAFVSATANLQALRESLRSLVDLERVE